MTNKHKTFIIDTNVLTQDPEAIYKFEDNIVVIPDIVIEELDNLKNRKDKSPLVKANVIQALRNLDRLREESPDLYKGVLLPGGGKLVIELNRECKNIPFSWSMEKADNRILSIAKSLSEEKDRNAILVTKDVALRVKATGLDIEAEDYLNERTSYEDIDIGWEDNTVPDNLIDVLYREGEIPWLSNATPNYGIHLRAAGDPQKTAMALVKNDGTPGNNKAVLLSGNKKISSNGYYVKKREQKFALEMLRQDDIPLVTISGETGSGKTMLALAAGLEKVLEEGTYKRILICRPNVPMGEDLGYLPGDETDKIAPYMRPVLDNLEQLLSSSEDSEDMIGSKIDYLFESRKIVTEAVAFLQGRSIVGQYIIIDEAQNLTPRQATGIVTRAGMGTKIVFTGDVNQINSPWLDSRTNGLTYTIEKMQGSKYHGHIHLSETLRSSLAEDAGRRMK